MTLEIDLIRALREPEYRDEVSEELEGDVTDMVRLEAADEIERLRALNAELVEALQKTRDDISIIVADHKLGKDRTVNRAMQRCRAALSRARSETPEGEG